MDIKEIITLSTDIFQGVAVVIALVAMVLEIRQSRISRDMDLMMNLSSSFRRRWEDKWEDIIRPEAATAHRNQDPRAQVEKEIRHMLNWIDWLGTCIRTGMLSNESVILNSIGIPIKEIINKNQPLIEADIREHGTAYWASLLTVAEKLDIPWTSPYT